jgi:hypothetical protein
MKPEDLVLFLIGAIVLVMILIWRRFRVIDRRLARMQQEINELRWIESRLFLIGVNARPGADLGEVESQKRVEHAPTESRSNLVPPASASK